jgi:RimJ/RimL family protein N-acetyltransferase
MISFGFQVQDLHRITAAIGPDNTASIAVVKKLGFTREGRLRDHVFTNGAWRDSELYSILVHEWNVRP